MTPSDYVLQYHHVWCTVFQESTHASGIYGSSGVLTPVLRYCNLRYTNAAGKKPHERLALKDHLLGFFKQRRKESDSGVSYSEGSGYSLLNTTHPVRGFPRSNFMASFSGKASPSVLCAMSQLLSYWRGHKRFKEGKDVAMVAEIVDKYLGVDCNGFIGNYLREKYAGISVGPSTPENIFKKNGTERQSPMQFQADDVIVFEGFHHVAIIDRVATRTDQYAECLVCESRGRDAGGPQMRWFDIRVKQDGKGKHVPWQYKIAGRDDIDCVVKIKGT